MKQRFQFGKLLIALGICAAMVLPCAAQSRKDSKPPQQPRQERRQAPERRAQAGRPSNDRPRSSMAPDRMPPREQTPRRQTESMGMIGGGGNRPPNARSESGRQPNFNPNRPPNASNRPRTFSPEERQRLQQDERRFRQLPPQQQQKAIRQRLGVLQDMPESARNQHLNDPNFTRGMSEEDKAMLRDLSHMHVGAPDPPNE